MISKGETQQHRQLDQSPLCRCVIDSLSQVLMSSYGPLGYPELHSDSVWGILGLGKVLKVLDAKHWLPTTLPTHFSQTVLVICWHGSTLGSCGFPLCCWQFSLHVGCSCGTWCLESHHGASV